MENNQAQKIGALIFVTTLLCIVEILFFFSNTFQIVKLIAVAFGATAIIYYLYAIVKVLTEE